MRVLLIYPYASENSMHGPAWIPLGPAYVAAALRARGHEAIIFDRLAIQVDVWPDAEAVDATMLQTVENFKPDMIGLFTISPLIYDTVHCAAIIRETFTGIMIAGGHHATAIPALTLEKIPELDGVVAGEGEEVLCHLLAGEDPASIPGLWWRRDDKIIAPPEPLAKLDKLDELPFPAFDLLKMAYYTRRNVRTIRGQYLSSVSLLTSRGCQFRCKFCSESLTYGKGVRFHSPEYVLELICRTLTDYPWLNGIYFHDNDFLADPDRAVKICEGLIDLGLHKKIRWAIQTRVNQLEPKILRILQRAGCSLIEIGVEAASQEVLDKVGKGIKIDDSERAITACHKAGIAVHAYMLTCTEGETLEDLDYRLQWVKKMDPDTCSWHPLLMHPGTALYQESGNDFFEMHDWTKENVRMYYLTDHFSRVLPAQRKQWMECYYAPYHKGSWRKAMIRHNGILQLLSFWGDKLRGKWIGDRLRD